MKPVDQTVFTVPGGNCFSACVASLLELPLEDVPYFMGDEPPDQPSAWFEQLSDWLRPRGWWAIPIPIGNGWKPEGLCILSGKSPRGDFDHCVVAHGLEVVHDPHPSRAGLESHKDVVVLVPIDPVARVIRELADMFEEWGNRIPEEVLDLTRRLEARENTSRAWHDAARKLHAHVGRLKKEQRETRNALIQEEGWFDG